MGYTDTKKLVIIYLKFKCDRASCIFTCEFWQLCPLGSYLPEGRVIHLT